jgi:CBS domain-containing protein
MVFSKTRQFLKENKLLQLVETKSQLIEISANAPPSDALNLLKKHHLLCIILCNYPSIASLWERRALARSWRAHGNHSYRETISWLCYGNMMNNLSILDVVIFLLQPSDRTARVADLIGRSIESRSLWIMDSNATIWQAMEPLFKGVHRLLISIQYFSGIEYRILTQSDICRYVLNHCESNPSLHQELNYSCESLGLIKNECISVASSDNAVEVFAMMASQGLNAVPVINNGILVNTLSLSDIRDHVHRDQWPSALRNNMTVGQFLQTYESKTLFYSKRTDSFHDVLAQILQHRVHRAWIADDCGRLTGVISLSDIIRILFYIE